MKRKKFKNYTFNGLLEMKEYYKWILVTTKNWTWRVRNSGKIRPSTWDQSYISFTKREMNRIKRRLKEIDAEIIFRKLTDQKETL